jgi:hypothetical protein
VFWWSKSEDLVESHRIELEFGRLEPECSLLKGRMVENFIETSGYIFRLCDGMRS